jgi:hypothetical protein
MNHWRTPGMLLIGLILNVAAGAASAATTTTLAVDFESPLFTPGAIGNTCCAAGQGGFAGPATVTTAQSHSGSQSLLTTGTTTVKALDPTQGEWPVAGFFQIPYASDWWAQAFVRVNSGGSGATFALSNSLGGCPLLQISGSGTPYFNSCTRDDSSHGSLGPSVLDQWVLLRMVHTASMGQGLDMSISGAGVDLTVRLDQYTGPGSGNPQHVGIYGNAYWDDISAGYGTAPAIVPVPAAGWLLGSACLSLLGRMRRKPSRI